MELLLEREPGNRPELLILGTAHLANRGRDVINPKIEDVLTERRQAEIGALVDKLAAFNPSHVAVEREDQADLNERYKKFRAGKLQASADEVDQFGMKLAHRLKHDRIYAVDWNGYSPGDPKEYDWFNQAQDLGHEERLAAISDPERIRWDVPLEEHTMTAWLLKLNQPERLLESHRIYYDIALVGKDERQLGAHWVGHWYARNLRIFGNLVRLAENPHDRVVAIYGMGHAHLLRQFALESGAFDLVEVEEVLR